MTATPQAATRQRRYGLMLLTLLSALAFMDRQILAVLLQPVKTEFGLSDLQIGLVTGLGFSLTFVLLGIPLGKLADRGERRTVLVWSRGIGALLGAAGAWASGFGACWPRAPAVPSATLAARRPRFPCSVTCSRPSSVRA